MVDDPMPGMDDDDIPEAIPLPQLVQPVDAGSAAAESSEPQAPVPVTLFTGYLGAGKTTLVKYILTERHGYRVAVLLNEYSAEQGIESAFLQDEQGGRSSAPNWVELSNGCLCCSVKGEFLQALEVLVAGDYTYDYVLVETSGLAHPGPIMASLWADEELEARVTLDGVVTVVDAPHICQQLAERRPGGAPNEAQLQVALADVILLNKVDLVTPQQLSAAEGALRAINTSATIHPTTFAQVDLALLLDRGAYRMRLPPQQNDPNSSSSGSRPSIASGSAAVQQGLPLLAGAGCAREADGGGAGGDAGSCGPLAAGAGDAGGAGGDAGSCKPSVGGGDGDAGGWGRPSAAALAWLSAAVEAASVGGGGGNPAAACTSCGVQQCQEHHHSSSSSSRGQPAAAGPEPQQHLGAQQHQQQQHVQPEHQHQQQQHQQHSLQPSHCSAHDASVTTLTLRLHQPLDLTRFKQWVEVLLWREDSSPDGNTPQQQQQQQGHGQQQQGHEQQQQGQGEQQQHGGFPPQQQQQEPGGVSSAGGVEVLRMKGLLQVAGDPRVHLFQAVYNLYDVAPGPLWQEYLAAQDKNRQHNQQQQHKQHPAQEQRQQQQQQCCTRLVVIGRHLDQAELQRQLDACAAV